jgi:hypothetical protein
MRRGGNRRFVRPGPNQRSKIADACKRRTANMNVLQRIAELENELRLLKETVKVRVEWCYTNQPGSGCFYVIHGNPDTTINHRPRSVYSVYRMFAVPHENKDLIAQMERLTVEASIVYFNKDPYAKKEESDDED